MGWLSGWDKRIKLTIDQTKVDTANQSNFPVLIYVSAASGIGDVDASCVFDELTSDGNRKKIAITTSDGTTECYVEIERWDDVSEKAWLWVKVPLVTYNADTDLYLYYDADHTDNTTYVGDTTDAVTHNVWDSDFLVVWHMAQDPTGGSGCIKDSTSNANDGTPGGSMTSGDLVDGKIGKGLDFDSANEDYIRRAGLSLSTRTSYTLEATIKLAQSGVNQRFVVLEDATTPDGEPQFFIRVSTDNFAQVYSRGHSSDTAAIVTDNVNLNDAAYHYVAGTIDGNIGKAELLVEGVSQGSVTQSQFTLDTMSDIVFGGFLGVTDEQFLKGVGDEVRISNCIRSIPWLKATNYSNIDNLITFGSEEIVTTGLFDGKVCISPTTLVFDGKTAVKDSTTSQFDGKAVVALVSEDEFDGKARIKDVTTIQFDGKTAVKNIATNLFDGKAWLYPARDFFDGKIWIKELIEGSVDLPSLGITGNTGGIGDVTLPFFEVLGEVSVGIDAQGNVTLPGLGVAGFTGAKCSYNLPSLGVSGTSVVGVAASGDVVLPIFGIDGQAFTDALVHGAFTLPALTVIASSIAGALCIGEVSLPSLGVSATTKIGTICTGAVTLPCLVVEGDSGHIPVGNGEVTLPLLKIYSTASILADPRDGCHVLRYNRWR